MDKIFGTVANKLSERCPISHICLPFAPDRDFVASTLIELDNMQVVSNITSTGVIMVLNLTDYYNFLAKF